MRTTWIVFFSALVILAGALIYETVTQRRAIEAAELEHLERQASIIEQYLGERLTQTFQALTAANMQYAGTDAGYRDHLADHLQTIAAALHGLREVALFDDRGELVVASAPATPGYDWVRQQALARAREIGRPDVLIVLPPLNASDGAAGMMLAVPRIGPQGRFDGIATAVLDPSCCTRLLDTIRHQQDAFASIAHGDGAAFLFSPERPDLAGRNLDLPGSMFRQHKEAGRQVSVMTGMNKALQVEQIVVAKNVIVPGLEVDRSLIVAVGRNHQAIFGQWQRNTLHHVTLLLVITLAGAGGLFGYQRRQDAHLRLSAAAATARQRVEERLQLAAEGAKLFIWEYAPASRTLTIDEQMAAFLDNSDPARTPLERWRSAVNPDDVGVLDAALAPPPGEGTTDAGTLRVRRPDGAVRTLRVRSRMIADPTGDTPRVIGTLQDVTELAAASALLEASEARLKAVFDVLPVGISVTDANGHIVDCNAASENLLEITREQHLARDYDGREWVIRHPDGRIMASADYASVRAMRTGQPVHGCEMRIETPGGERWLSVSAIPVFPPGATPTSAVAEMAGVVIAYVDVGEARRTELDLRKLTRAVDQSGAAVLITDDEGVIEYANAMAIASYGFSADELLGQTPRLFRSGQTPDAVYRAMWSEIRAGRVWRGELLNRRRDGSLVHELVSISPVRDHTGRVTHFVAVREDLSERIENERLRQDLVQRISRVERMEVLSAMAGGVAHDFNNILVAILGFSGLGKLALGAAGGPPKVVSYFEEIEIAGHRARQLVQQLLAFSRGGTVKPTRIDLADAAGEAIGLLRASFPDTLRITAEIEPDLPLIEMDATQLSRLFANPLRNARDATDGHGDVVVSVRRMNIPVATSCDSCHKEFAGDFLMIAVIDQGCGVADHLRSRIFEPFFTTWRVADGAGMGLAVVHGILHACGGHVRVLSRAEGGTELQMFLPADLLRDNPAPDSAASD